MRGYFAIGRPHGDAMCGEPRTRRPSHHMLCLFLAVCCVPLNCNPLFSQLDEIEKALYSPRVVPLFVGKEAIGFQIHT